MGSLCEAVKATLAPVQRGGSNNTQNVVYGNVVNNYGISDKDLQKVVDSVKSIEEAIEQKIGKAFNEMDQRLQDYLLDAVTTCTLSRHNGKLECREQNEMQQTHGSLAIYFLHLRLYSKALSEFEKAMNGGDCENSELYYYAAICLLNGKKPFLQQRATIDKVIEYLNAATALNDRGIYYFFLAYVKYDFFARKFYCTEPAYPEVLATAKRFGYNGFEVKKLFALLGTNVPQELLI